MEDLGPHLSLPLVRHKTPAGRKDGIYEFFRALLSKKPDHFLVVGAADGIRVSMIPRQYAESFLLEKRQACHGAFSRLVVIHSHKASVADDQVEFFCDRDCRIAFQFFEGGEMSGFQVSGKNSGEPVF
ncbi:hypothetical protein ES703_124631 [subsurface metagenome]